MKRLGMGTSTLVAFGILLSVHSALAQAGLGTVSLQAQDLEVRQALKALFAQTGASYAIDPAVQGRVTVSLKDVPFDTALRVVVQQVRAEYVVEGGVYVIRPKSQPPPLEVTRTESEPPVPAPLRIGVYDVYHADPYVIVMLLQGRQPHSPEWWTLSNLFGPAGWGFASQGFGGPRGLPGGFGQAPWSGSAGAWFGGSSGAPGGEASGLVSGRGPSGGFPGRGWSSGSFRGGGPSGGRGVGASGGQGAILEEGTLLVDPSTNRIIYIPPRGS